MIRFPDGEELLRETRGKTKKYGSGTLYITSKRVCFDSDRDGLCLDLGYGTLFDWDIIKKGVLIKWQELPEGRTQLTTEDPIHKVEIELESVKVEKKKLSTPQIVHYTLFYAYTNFYNCEGRRGYGWHMNEKGEIVHRFGEVRTPYTTQKRVVLLDPARDSIEKQLVMDGTGDAKLDQMIFENNEMWTAWKKNSRYGHEDGFISDITNEKNVTVRLMEQLEQAVSSVRENIVKTEERITALKEAGDTDELEKVIPTNWEEKENYLGRIRPKTTYTPTGTIYTQLEHQKKTLKAELRIKEILSGIKFDYGLQWLAYDNELKDILMEKLYAGEGISTCSPQIEKWPDHIIEAKRRIEERRRKFNQGQT